MAQKVVLATGIPCECPAPCSAWFSRTELTAASSWLQVRCLVPTFFLYSSPVRCWRCRSPLAALAASRSASHFLSALHETHPGSAWRYGAELKTAAGSCSSQVVGDGGNSPEACNSLS